MNDLDTQEESALLEDTFVPSPTHEKAIRAAFDPTKQPNWANHGFVYVNGGWRDRSRYNKEKKEEAVAEELAARGIYPEELEVDEPYMPPPGHITYTQDELQRKGLSMMEYMRQLDEENKLKRLANGIGLAPIIPKN